MAWETCRRTRAILISRRLCTDEQERPGQEVLDVEETGLSELYPGRGSSEGRDGRARGAWEEDVVLEVDVVCGLRAGRGVVR